MRHVVQKLKPLSYAENATLKLQATAVNQRQTEQKKKVQGKFQKEVYTSGQSKDGIIK